MKIKLLLLMCDDHNQIFTLDLYNKFGVEFKTIFDFLLECSQEGGVFMTFQLEN